jgi:flagellar hook protein FlgE
MLSVSGNNIANGDTISFKSDRATFSTMFARTIEKGSKASESVGGTNPMQLGNGVQVSSIDKNMAAGNLRSTGNDFDIGIDGEGFFVVNDGQSNIFTRDGSFDVDAENYLVDPATGYRVQRNGMVGEDNGFQVPGNSDIKVPYDTVLPNSKTDTIDFSGNLSSGSTLQSSSVLVGSDFEYTRNSAGGGPATRGDAFGDITELEDVNVGDTISISGRFREGGVVSDTFTYGDPAVDPSYDGETLGDLVDYIENTFNADAQTDVSVTVDDGQIRMESRTPGYSRLDLGLSSSNPDVLVPTDFDYRSVGGLGSQTTNITVYDAQGSEHALTGTFVRHNETDNLWDFVINDVKGADNVDDNRIAGIQFDNEGTYQGVTEEDGFANTAGDLNQSDLDNNIEVSFTGVSSSQTMHADFGEPGEYEGLTQFGGDSTAGAVEQDGYSSGTLEDVSIDNSGVVRGTFTNGVSLDIAQLSVALFGNAQGLERSGDNYYRHVPATGSVQYTVGNSGRAGKVRQGVLEESNVDIANEFTKLITAQRGFQINSRTVRMTNTMLKELASIAR